MQAAKIVYRKILSTVSNFLIVFYYPYDVKYKKKARRELLMARYTIENGIYKKDGKPVFALGVSYYPSYHERKVPVPPEADRIGEARLDLKDMRDFGFNIVRCAALGDVYYGEGGEVVTETPLLDAISEISDECDIGVMLRLQGYSMNLSGYTDTLMINHESKEMDKSVWYDFVRDCLFHDGLNKDNDNATKALSKHFARYPAIVGWQTYNEPHYPSSGMFDYHPRTVAAYRLWLVDKGYMTEDEAREHEPPRSRPEAFKDTKEWILWRTFSKEAMTNFLCHSSFVAKEASGLETMTCITSGPTQANHPIKCDEFFGIAEGMDALGITQYYLVRKPEAYIAAMNLSLAESAAALAGKPLWIVEYDAKTDTPSDLFVRNTLVALGTGIKGLLYYQWRGDHVYPDSPEGNGFGILNYDRTKTEKYDTAKKVVEYVNSRSDILLSAAKHRSGVGILRSFYGFTNADAKENSGAALTRTRYEETRNSWLDSEKVFFTEMIKRGIEPSFVRAEDLKENKLGIKHLFIPNHTLISDEELKLIGEFEKSGGTPIYTNDGCRGFINNVYATKNIRRTKFTSYLDASDLVMTLGIKPFISFTETEESLLIQTLDTDEGYMAVVTNIENIPRPAREPVITVSP